MAEHQERVRRELGQRISEIQSRARRLSPLDMHAQMDSIREEAGRNGMAALEGLARCTAQLALLPGHQVTTQCCLEHMEAALASQSPADCRTILAVLAARLH